jgi:hypothetical protein
MKLGVGASSMNFRLLRTYQKGFYSIFIFDITKKIVRVKIIEGLKWYSAHLASTRTLSSNSNITKKEENTFFLM